MTTSAARTAAIRATVMAFGGLTALLVMSVAGRPDRVPPITGFRADRLAAQHARETQLMRSIDTEQISSFHRFLTAEPHIAGSSRDRQLAEWTRDQWRRFGLEDVEISEHHVLLPYAREVAVVMTSPRRWQASLAEEPLSPLPFHAYSASGEVTAAVVYANNGMPEDYEWLTNH